MNKHDAEQLAHEINAARPQTHRGVVMWQDPGVYCVDCRNLRTLQRAIFHDRTEYLLAHGRELQRGGAAVH